MYHILKQWWADHGTKILGFFSSVVAFLSLIDHETVGLIQSTIGDLWAHIILIVSGLATAYRGFTNSRKIAAATAT